MPRYEIKRPGSPTKNGSKGTPRIVAQYLEASKGNKRESLFARFSRSLGLTRKSSKSPSKRTSKKGGRRKTRKHKK